MQDIAKGLTSLTFLDLRACRRLTNAAAVTLSKACAARSRRGTDWLRDLDLGGCKRINDKGNARVQSGPPDGAGIEALADGCSSLTALDLRGLDAVTPSALSTLCFRLTNLRYRALRSLRIAHSCSKLIPPPCAGRPTSATYA